jgi:hypothetical protein
VVGSINARSKFRKSSPGSVQIDPASNINTIVALPLDEMRSQWQSEFSREPPKGAMSGTARDQDNSSATGLAEI